MKTLWAVACAAFAAMLLISALSGCATAPKKTDNAPLTATPGAATPAPAVASQSGNAPQTTGAQPQGVPAASASLQYRIGAEDVLRISVWENTQLTLDVVVRPDGKISFPLIQDVQAEGLTAAELAIVIHQKLLTYVKDPQVSVIVTQVNAPKVYVLGSVVRPGPIPLRSEISILQALSMAGGFTQFASPRSIKLVRGTGFRQEVRKINYYDLLDEGGEGNYLLQPGDTIVVP